MSYTEVLQELTRDMVADNNMMSALQRREATLLGQENALSNQVDPVHLAPYSLAPTHTHPCHYRPRIHMHMTSEVMRKCKFTLTREGEHFGQKHCSWFRTDASSLRVQRQEACPISTQ
jgi:hypothetical protein